MSIFRYRATDQDGGLIDGTLEADTVAQAVHQLEQQGLQVTSIEICGADSSLPVSESLSSRPAAWHNKLQQMLDRKSDWMEPFQAIIDELPAGLVKRQINDIMQTLERDVRAADFVAQPELGTLLPLVIRGNEQGDRLGNLARWLDQITVQKNRRMARLRAIAYPALLSVLALVLLMALCLFVVPIFREMFAEFGMSLPGITLAVIWVSDRLTTHLLPTIATLVPIGLIAIVGIRIWRGNALTNRILGRFVSGTTLNLSAMGRLCDSMAELLWLGAPLPDALEIAGRHCGHRFLCDAASQTATQLRNASSPAGQRFYERFPSTFQFVLAHSQQSQVEQAGASESAQPNRAIPLLRELARVYLDRSQRRFDWFSAALPTFAILVSGIVVGVVVLAMLAPLFFLVTALA